MKINRLNIVLVLGLVAIVGILVMQVLWTVQAFNAEEKKFSQKVHIGLLHTLERLYDYDDKEFPLQNPIKKISNDYYIVNVNNDFDASVLEYCLKTEFEKANLVTDFEYAVYKCESDEMVYGNYISFSDKQRKASLHFPKHGDLVYYFAIRFPRESSYLFGNLQLWLVMSGILVLILIIYLYSLFTILQQKKYSDLQRDFINNMTHEFKTPLSSILLASNYLKKQEKIRENDKLEKYTGIIIDQSNKLNNHIEKILNIAKWDSAPLELSRTQVVVVPVLERVIENLQLKHEDLVANIISVEKELAIYADEFHFSNLVYNLLDNSIKYCEGKPQLTIHLTEKDTILRMDFIDNGIGIAEKEMSFVFDKFYRAAGNKGKEVTGFGLGLYYVKKICLLHRWKINIMNNVKEGLTVSLLIPRTI